MLGVRLDMTNQLYHKGRPRVGQTAKAAWAMLRKPEYTPLLASALGLSKPAVSKWKHVPEDRLDTVATILGIPREVLRPDLSPPGLESLMPPSLADYLKETQ